jgi:hypothetical protein
VVVGEEAAEVGVLEGVVVGQGDFVDVVGIDEALPRLVARSIPSSVHAVGIIHSQ